MSVCPKEETSQLRRLHEALDSNRFDRYLSRELGNAAMQALKQHMCEALQNRDPP